MSYLVLRESVAAVIAPALAIAVLDPGSNRHQRKETLARKEISYLNRCRFFRHCVCIRRLWRLSEVP